MVYEPPVYPTSIPSQTGTTPDLPDKLDDIDWFMAADHNSIKKELLAVMIELGTLPKGTFASVKDRLDAAYKKSYFIQRVVSDAGNDVAYTGIGFRPAMIIFFAVNPATSQVSIGIAQGNTNMAIYNQYGVSANTWTSSGSQAIQFQKTSGDYCVGKVLTFDADGFTLRWAKAGSPTGTAFIIYIALR